MNEKKKMKRKFDKNTATLHSFFFHLSYHTHLRIGAPNLVTTNMPKLQSSRIINIPLHHER